jgi:Membrane bound beta barrel domain (DUF5777)
MKHLLTGAVFCLTSIVAAAQETDMLKDIEPEATHQKKYVTNAFKSSRVINGHSMEFIGKGVLDFRILHRFGTVSSGFDQLFGLDQASMRMGFDYGVDRNVTLGIGRSTFQKELDGFIKYRPLWQTERCMPLSLVLLAGVTMKGATTNSQGVKASVESRMGYYYQVIAGRKFNERFSLQLSPTMVHRNEADAAEDNDIYAIGVGARYKLTKRIALVADYFYVANGLQSTRYNPLSVGIDIETGGHVFQLHFSNTSGMNERAFITETTNRWGKGEIRFGFNLSRVFSVGGHRAKGINLYP